MNRRILNIFAVMLLMVGGCAEAPVSPAAATIECRFYDASVVNTHLHRTEPMEGTASLFGAIVPHHAPFMQLTADVLAGVEREIDTVVVISPNHACIGEAVQISGEGYFWTDGSVHGDAALAAALLAEPRLLAVEAGDVLVSDHGASIQMPYIRAAFPEAKVATVYLSPTVTGEQVELLAALLLGAAEGSELLILASIDFSHGQNPEQQRLCDDETRDAIRRQDHTLIRHLENANLDAPQVLSLMLRLAQKRGIELQELAYEADIFPENGTMQGASYFVWGMD